MDIALWGLVIAFVIQIIGVSYYYGKLNQKVNSIDTTLKNGFTCKMHDSFKEEVIRLEERSTLAKEIAIAVASAKKQWERGEE